MSQALCNQPITTAIGGAGAQALAGVFEIEPSEIKNLALCAQLTYGSGGTSIDAYVQTSFDGVTWFDIANFHFTTSALNKAFNLSQGTVNATQITPTASGTLAANTAVDGFIGGKVRVLLKTVGTYVGTTLALYADGARLRGA